jgi:predicted DNA-binding protein with PD1-like motif
MDYRTGTIGRVLTIRFDHGDDLLEGLQEIVCKEKISSGWFQILGGLRHAGVVTGPKEPVMPPEPVWQEVDGAREVIGTGSVHLDGDEPKIHLHAAMGHHGDTLTACVRKSTRVYLILEVVLFELEGIAASRPWYEKGGFNRLTFS